MKPQSKITAIVLALVLVSSSTPAFSLSGDQQKEFDRILDLPVATLTEEAGALLEKKYPDENWDSYKFPKYVFTNDSVEVGYMIAVKVPELLKKSQCYCFCEAMGHENLLHCFWKKGKAGKKLDAHGADCKVCWIQAMLAFLWKEMGASDEDISQGGINYFLPKDQRTK